MREILFRGKRLDNGEWVQGSFLRDGEAHRLLRCEDLPFSDCYIVPKTDRDNVRSYLTQGILLNTSAYHVFPDTIGQYTGLKDKIGRRIFEGDLVKSVLPQTTAQMGFAWPIMPVVFRDGVFGLLDHRDDVMPFRSFAPRVTFEVLGNIHDNPELLKEEAE